MSFGMRQAVKPVTQRISYGAQSIKEFMAETAVCYAPGLTVNFCRFAEKRSIKKARIAAFKSYAEHKDDQKSFGKVLVILQCAVAERISWAGPGLLLAQRMLPKRVTIFLLWRRG